MKVSLIIFFLIFLDLTISFADRGFYISNDKSETSFKYQNINNLIVFSAVINDSVSVNLLFDTGCRGVILFGKKFQKMFNQKRSKDIVFSGVGSSNPVSGYLVTDNDFKIGGATGVGIPIIVAPRNPAIDRIGDIDGVIGYMLTSRFEIEVNPERSMITFRNPLFSVPKDGFYKVSLEYSDAVPIAQSTIRINDQIIQCCLLIDTGSQFSLLWQTDEKVSGGIIGIGFNGSIKGEDIEVEAFSFGDWKMKNRSIAAYRVNIPKKSKLSLGMEFLKDYVFIINSMKSEFYFKEI